MPGSHGEDRATLVRVAHQPHSVRTMFGDFLREAAVLVFVFAPLEPFLDKTHPTNWLTWLPSVVVLSLFLLSLGMWVEVRGKKE